MIGSLGDGVVRADGTICGDLQAQLLAGGAPFPHSTLIHRVDHSAHRHKDRIDLQGIDGFHAFIEPIRWAIAHATLHVKLHFQAVTFSHSGDVLVGIHHGHLGGKVNLAGGHLCWTCHQHPADFHGLRAATADHQFLGIEEDVKNVLANTGDDGVFMGGTCNPHSCDGAAFQTSQKGPS